MKVAEVPANALVIMTPELYQEFCQGGCVPACHFTDEWIDMGQQFHLSTVQHLKQDGTFEDRDVMLSGAVTVAEYNEKQQKKREKHADHYEHIAARQRKGGCYRVDGKIVI